MNNYHVEPSEIDDSLRKPYTDLANAERLAKAHGDRIRYVTSWGAWIVWNGKIWARDDSREIDRLAQQVVRDMYVEAADNPNRAERGLLVEWAAKSEDRRRLSAMIDLAATQTGIAINANQLDRDPDYFNAQNGMIDLTDGSIWDHEPDHLNTKISPVAYDPNAEAPQFEAFMNRIMDGNEDLISYLQRLMGFCLTGDISEQIFPIFFGSGANGKSVLVDLVSWICAEYAGQAPDSLLTVGIGNEHPTEIANLQGKRLVVGSETEEDRKLRVALVKKMTGDAKLVGRLMRQDFFEFPRTHKTILVTNHKPRVSESKDAIWRRIQLVPFRVVIPEAERDPHLLDKLKAEGRGVLAWAVRGCLEWRKRQREVGADALGLPPDVSDETHDFRLESNPLADFLDDCCWTGNVDNTVSRREILEAYNAWAKSAGERSPLSRNSLYDRLAESVGIEECSVTTQSGKRSRGFRGVGIIHIPRNMEGYA